MWWGVHKMVVSKEFTLWPGNLHQFQITKPGWDLYSCNTKEWAFVLCYCTGNLWKSFRWEVAIVFLTHSIRSEGKWKSELNWENREFSKKLLDYRETLIYAATLNADSMHLSTKKKKSRCTYILLHKPPKYIINNY